MSSGPATDYQVLGERGGAVALRVRIIERDEEDGVPIVSFARLNQVEAFDEQDKKIARYVMALLSGGYPHMVLPGETLREIQECEEPERLVNLILARYPGFSPPERKELFRTASVKEQLEAIRRKLEKQARSLKNLKGEEHYE